MDVEFVTKCVLAFILFVGFRLAVMQIAAMIDGVYNIVRDWYEGYDMANGGRKSVLARRSRFAHKR